MESGADGERWEELGPLVAGRWAWGVGRWGRTVGFRGGGEYEKRKTEAKSERSGGSGGDVGVWADSVLKIAVGGDADFDFGGGRGGSANGI